MWKKFSMLYDTSQIPIINLIDMTQCIICHFFSDISTIKKACLSISKSKCLNMHNYLQYHYVYATTNIQLTVSTGNGIHTIDPKLKMKLIWTPLLEIFSNNSFNSYLGSGKGFLASKITACDFTHKWIANNSVPWMRESRIKCLEHF